VERSLIGAGQQQMPDAGLENPASGIDLSLGQI
jgi:hypothetical protein